MWRGAERGVWRGEKRDVEGEREADKRSYLYTPVTLLYTPIHPYKPSSEYLLNNYKQRLSDSTSYVKYKV